MTSLMRCCPASWVRRDRVAGAVNGEADFSARLLAWFDLHGRHDLPWQHPRTPYRVWLAEVMLQQTQVSTVIPYYLRFLERFPDLGSLAQASLDEVNALWSGLGYYTRARNLQQAARRCMDLHDGALPQDFTALSALPGIGRSTAAAILAQAHGQRHAILDGNVRRVLARHDAIAGDATTPAVQRELWSRAEALLPTARLADYTQALMDLGSGVCKRAAPRCGECPVADSCQALAQGRVQELPQRRARRERPLRQTCMWLLEDGLGRLLLERRPPLGIWAGLWSLPEAALSAQFDELETKSVQHLQHEFTHFSLQIEVRHLRVRSRAVSDDNRNWWSREQALALGLPQPVRRIIEQLAPAAP